MEDNRSFEIQEQSGSRVEITGAARALESATYEPEARVEAVESFEQADAVQTAFVEVVDAAASEEVSGLPVPLPGPASSGDEISAIPITVPDEGPEQAGNLVSATPITLPGQEHPVGDAVPAGSSTDEISATPITLPGQERPGDEVSALPLPLPDPSTTGGTDEVSATPIPLPDPPEPTRVEGGPSAGQPAEEVSIIPITIPDSGMARPDAGSGGDQVSAIPITVPDSGMARPETVTGDEVSTMPIPIPDPSTTGGTDEVSATPITLPGQERPTEGRPSVGHPSEEISAIPITIPDSGMARPDAGSGGDQVSAIPITVPDSGMARPDTVTGGEVSTLPLPIPDPSTTGGTDEVSATPITLPDATRTGDEVSATPITLPDAARDEIDDENSRLPFDTPEQRVTGQESEGALGPGGIGESIPGTSGPGFMGSIPGLGDDPFGPGTGSPFGDGSGRVPGGSGDLFGDNPLDGVGFPGIPNFNDPFGNLFGDGPGGIGSDTPGGPGLINFGNTPAGGGASEGGGGSGAKAFWEWNFLYEQEGYFNRGREVTAMHDEVLTSLEFDPDYTPPTAVDPRDSVDPFNETVEEWGTAHVADYDEADEERAAFVQAQINYDAEKEAQQAAKDKVQGGQASTPRPDGDGEKGSPHGVEDINIARVGGILVGDPAYTQGIAAGSTVNYGKTPGGVTDPGYDDTGAAKGGSGVKPGREQIIDPPEQGN